MFGHWFPDAGLGGVPTLNMIVSHLVLPDKVGIGRYSHNHSWDPEM